jgi:hypothetical protein
MVFERNRYGQVGRTRGGRRTARAVMEALEGRELFTASPYVIPTNPLVTTQSLLTAGDAVGGYVFAGTPDGVGAYDNGDGTFTVLINHEFGNTAGAAHTHNASLGVNGHGAFVSKWVIDKSTLQVVSGGDLIHTLVLNGSTSLNLNRLCSADLPAVSAFFDAATGVGTTDRIFMNGEESAGGRVFGNVATGALAGTSYELPLLGKFAHENVVANPFAQGKTIVAGTDDSTPGGVYMYVGTKTAAGSPVDRAGLTNGINYGIQVAGVAAESRDFGLAAAGPGVTTSGRFSLVNGAGTLFLRPEDGAWDPSRPNDFYFVTTDRFDQVQDGLGAQAGRSRLWRLRFDDLTDPTAGGAIEMMLDGSEGGNMFDNIAVDGNGRILIQEDVGNSPHNGKVWLYEIATDRLVQVARHDPARFGDIGLSAAAPFNQDEESSGVLDVSGILGAGTYLLVDQAHYSINDPRVVEGGQLLVMKVPVGPTLAGVTVNDGAVQRSRVNSVTITLNGAVPASNILAGAFTLTRAEGGTFAAAVTSVSTAGGQTRITLAFAGAGVITGALPDGHYSLAIDGGKITDGLGQALDADRDGATGGVTTVKFAALFGDLNGDGRVDSSEVVTSARANGAKIGDPDYRWYLDFNGDGVVDGRDHREVAQRHAKK